MWLGMKTCPAPLHSSLAIRLAACGSCPGESLQASEKRVEEEAKALRQTSGV
jgi:hypothetical protein